jgi:hypothetical protein
MLISSADKQIEHSVFLPKTSALAVSACNATSSSSSLLCSSITVYRIPQIALDLGLDIHGCTDDA